MNRKFIILKICFCINFAWSTPILRYVWPNAFLLVPGVGSQGGSIAAVAKAGMNNQCGLLVNSSRGIIYKSKNSDFAEAAMTEAKNIQEEMAIYLSQKGLILNIIQLTKIT